MQQKASEDMIKAFKMFNLAIEQALHDGYCEDLFELTKVYGKLCNIPESAYLHVANWYNLRKIYEHLIPTEELKRKYSK